MPWYLAIANIGATKYHFFFFTNNSLMVNISATEREPKEFRLKEGTELKLACIHDQPIQIMIY